VEKLGRGKQTIKRIIRHRREIEEFDMLNLYLEEGG
jgi:hypothetical protein